jgi:hypothetical protein
MFVAHPFRNFFNPVHFRPDDRQPPSLTPAEAARLPIFELVDEVEVANGACTPHENHFSLAVARILGKQGIGSSDAHSTHGLGCFATVFERPLADERDLIAELRAATIRPRACSAAASRPSGRMPRTCPPTSRRAVRAQHAAPLHRQP